MKLNKSAKTALIKNLGLRKGEKILIIYDSGKKKIAQAFYDEAKKITNNSQKIEMPLQKYNGQEPPKNVAEKMFDQDVIVITTTKSASHTSARKNATIKGARIASMPGITEDMMARTLSADYNKIKKDTCKLCDVLNKGKKAEITTSRGTNLVMKIGNKSLGRDGGIFIKKKMWGNLPEGEACIAPVEGSTNGIIIIDASMAGLGKLTKPIKIEIRNGYATKITGGREAKKLDKLLKSFKDKRVYNVAELGIGTNPKAKITGNVLEDEKVKGTCHIALGNNTSYDGGKIDAPCHLDGIIIKPTITIDGKKIMNKGKIIIKN